MAATKETRPKADVPLPHRLERIGLYHQQPGCHPNGRTIQPGVELVELVTGGRGWVRDRGALVEVGPGTLIWHVAGDHTIERSDFDNPYRCLAVRFAVADTGRRRVPHLSKWPEVDTAKTLSSDVVRHYVDERFDRQVLMLYVYSRLLYQARRYHHGLWASDIPEPIRRVLKLVEARYAEPLDVADLAHCAGWSIPHLHARFREHLDQSPHQYLIQRRMQAAKALLAGSDMPLKQIATACGYSNDASFCRQFRMATGLTAGAYRRHNVYNTAPGVRG